jgi:hypothetical protein
MGAGPIQATETPSDERPILDCEAVIVEPGVALVGKLESKLADEATETIVASESGGTRTWNRAPTRPVVLALTRNRNA